MIENRARVMSAFYGPLTEVVSIMQRFMNRWGVWVIFVVAFLVGLRWILGENHSVYGDEAAHIQFTAEAVRLLQSIRQLGADTFLVSGRYPPLFYYLGAPWVLPASDPVLAGRAFSLFMSILTALIFYHALRVVVGGWLGVASTIILLGTSWYLEVSRYYLIESMLALELALLFYFTVHYVLDRKLAYLLSIGLIHAAGMITKFNFAFYSIWLLGPVAFIIIYEGLTVERDTGKVIQRLAAISVPTFVLALPWYAYQVGKPGSAMVGLSIAIQTGHLPVPRSVSEVFDWSFTAAIKTFPLVTVVITAAVVLWGVAMVAARRVSIRNINLRLILGSLAAAVIVVSVLLVSIGLSEQLRWHLQFLFLPVVLAAALSKLSPIVKATVSALCAMVAIVNIWSSAIGPVRLPSWLTTESIQYLGRPSGNSVGIKETAMDLIRFERSGQVGGARNVIFFAFHEHRGVHSSALSHYLHSEGSQLTAVVGAFNDLPLDLHNIFEGGFLAVREPLATANAGDPEIIRYQRWLSTAPPAYWSKLQLVSDVAGRFGAFRVYYVPAATESPRLVEAMIESGKEIDGERFRLFWQAQELYWRRKFRQVDDATTRKELESIKASVKRHASLNPIHAPKILEMCERVSGLQTTAR